MRRLTREEGIYLLPLAGLLVGAAGGKALGVWRPAAVKLAALAGPLFGSLVTGDNLAMVCGLLGLLLATALAVLIFAPRRP